MFIHMSMHMFTQCHYTCRDISKHMFLWTPTSNPPRQTINCGRYARLLPDGYAWLLPDDYAQLLPDGYARLLPDGYGRLLPDGYGRLLRGGSVVTGARVAAAHLRLERRPQRAEQCHGNPILQPPHARLDAPSTAKCVHARACVGACVHACVLACARARRHDSGGPEFVSTERSSPVC